MCFVHTETASCAVRLGLVCRALGRRPADTPPPFQAFWEPGEQRGGALRSSETPAVGRCWEGDALFSNDRFAGFTKLGGWGRQVGPVLPQPLSPKATPGLHCSLQSTGLTFLFPFSCSLSCQAAGSLWVGDTACRGWVWSLSSSKQTEQVPGHWLMERHLAS